MPRTGGVCGDRIQDFANDLVMEPTEGAPNYKENIGIVTSVQVDQRGGRPVAMAKIIPLGADNKVTHEIEVFLACLKVISPSEV